MLLIEGNDFEMEIEIAGDGWDVLVIIYGLLERGGSLKMKIISEKLYYKIYFNLISQ
jgi:hypothetical protein